MTSLISGFMNPYLFTVVVATPVQYPPAALTGASTNLSSQPYGNGYYYVTYSAFQSFGTNVAYQAFNYITNSETDGWSTNSWLNSPNHGSTTMTATSSNNVDWLQIQLPNTIVLNNYKIWCRNDPGYTAQSPTGWWICGSNDGTTWTIIDGGTSTTPGRTGISWTSQNQVQTFTLATTPAAYSYFRLVVTTTNGSNWLIIPEWQLFGN